MKRRAIWLGCCLLGPLWLLLWMGQAMGLPAAASHKLDDSLQTTLPTLSPETSLRFIVYLTEQPELHEERLPEDKVARRQAVVDQLQQHTAAHQAPLLPVLNALQQEGTVHQFTPLWIINAIAVEGNAAAITTLTAHPTVARVTLDVARPYLTEPAESYSSTVPTALTWGLRTIKAAETWHGLGVTGSGVVIAIMDTGADWQHPALAANYRGSSGSHTGHWFDATSEAAAEPVDPHGHGTHVAGTAVGQGNIGVAPGASWIAVRMLDSYGYGYLNEIYQAFQWLMAPGGNPALAPDLVNASWGSSDPIDTSFYAPILALHAAGIVPIFAAGNTGPFISSVNSPASLPDVWAVGASDWRDVVTWFSSRGPSPLTNENKPDLLAPGAMTLSALPGGAYGTMSGTSMATPHVVGAAALLLSTNPTLSRQELRSLLQNTAVPIAPPHPNPDSGYGRLDVNAAAATQINHGLLTGSLVLPSATAPLIRGAALTLTTSSGAAIPLSLDANNQFRLAVRPGVYQLHLSAPGYEPLIVSGIGVLAGQTRIRHLTPTAQPYSQLRGFVWDSQGNPIVGAMVAAAGTVWQAETNADGWYTLSLPIGVHQLRAAANGHQVKTFYFYAGNSGGHYLPFTLASRPAVLLVNDGYWHYRDYAAYYEQALYDAGYGFDSFSIYSPYNEAPTAGQLLPYQIVVWASPGYSPGTVDGHHALMDYLDEGGKLLVFGPNVALYDSHGSSPQGWWYNYLRGRWLGRQSAPFNLTGAAGTPFAGLSFILNGPGSAANQIQTDQVAPQLDSWTRPLLHYGDGRAAALQAGACEPYQIVYLGFGLEGVSPAGVRPQIIQRTVDWLMAPPLTEGVFITPTASETLAVPGETLSYTFAIHNASETMTDTFTLALSGGTWSSTLITSTLTLGPCQIGPTVVQVTVPTGLPANSYHSLTLTATSANNPGVSQQATLQHKTPGHILFVDDDRFFDLEDRLLDALTANGLTYDVWETGWRNTGGQSPPAALLPFYDLIIWYNGYDWYAPILPHELAALEQYLAQGGRLLLTSQDFLYYHHRDPFSHHYLGVQTHFEGAEPTLVIAEGSLRQAGLTQPLPLEMAPYQNFADGLVPAAGVPLVWHDHGLPGGLTNQGAAANGEQWRSIFLAFPLEMLPSETLAAAANGMVGWLSDLGDSIWAVDENHAPLGGSSRVFTLTLRNQGTMSHEVTVINQLPKLLTVDSGSISGGGSYDPITRQISWQGTLLPGGEWEIRYVAATDPAAPPGSRLDNNVAIYIPRHNFTWRQNTTLWVGVPDLRSSYIAVSPVQPTQDHPVTYTLTLHNQGNIAAPVVTATFFLPLPLNPITDTLLTSSGLVTLTQGQVQWWGELAPGDTITVSLQLTGTMDLQMQYLFAAALISDSLTDPLLITHQTAFLAPYRFYLPTLRR